jgi:hypothetical protein
MNMSEFAVQLVAFGVGGVLGSYFTMKWLAFTTRQKRRARVDALNEIANYQWNTGEHNDAVVICRIALRGLAGE